MALTYDPAIALLERPYRSQLYRLIRPRRLRRWQATGAGESLRLIAGEDPTAAIVGRELQRWVDGEAPDPEAEAWVSRIEARREDLIARGGAVRCSVGAPHFGRQRSFSMRVERLASISSTRPPRGLFLMGLVRSLRPSSCVEIGSALGFSAAYQAAGLEINGSGKLVCIEASADCAGLARETLSTLGLERAEVLVGRGAERLGEVAESSGPFQLAFLDDDHRRAGTIEMADLLIEALAPGGVLLIDDIRLSRGMLRGWKVVSRDPRLSTASDLGRMGMCVRAG
jgi:predicted O-methyltransferase YrrM